MSLAWEGSKAIEFLGVGCGVGQGSNQWHVLVDDACTDRDYCLEKLCLLIFPHHNPQTGSNEKPACFPSFSKDKARLGGTLMS